MAQFEDFRHSPGGDTYVPPVEEAVRLLDETLAATDLDIFPLLYWYSLPNLIH